MEPERELGAGGWVLPLPHTEDEVSQKEDIVAGGWIPHLLEKAEEETSNDTEVHYDEIICQLKSKLEDAEPNEVEEYIQSKEGSQTLRWWKFMSNLRKKGLSELVTGAAV